MITHYRQRATLHVRLICQRFNFSDIVVPNHAAQSTFILTNLPPLKSLSAFAVAARTLHFGQAGEQLHISQSAISHQIKKLETFLGCKLFYREANKLLLTEQGKQLADSVGPAFEQIRATCEILTGKLDTALKLGVSSAFAFHRLTPEMSHFSERHKALDIRLSMLTCTDDPTRLDLDIMLVEKPIEHVSYECERLKTERYFPVAIPSVAQQVARREINDWQKHLRLIDLQDFNCWQHWFVEQGQSGDIQAQLQFGNTLLMLQAALSGQGIALLGETLIANELDQGNLVKLAETPFVFAEEGFYVCTHQKRRSDANVRLIKQWLKTLVNTP